MWTLADTLHVCAGGNQLLTYTTIYSQIDIRRAERDDKVACVLTNKINAMVSSIGTLHTLLSAQTQGRSLSVVNDTVIYGHVRALKETAAGFASNASVVWGNSSSAGTVKGFPAAQSGAGDSTTQDDITHIIGAPSVLGEPLSKEKHVQVLNWIPAKGEDGFHDSLKSATTTPGDDVSGLSDALGDLDVELHEKRLALGLDLLSEGKFEEATWFFSRALMRMENGSMAVELQPSLINDVKVLLARSLAGQEKGGEAVEVLSSIIDGADGSDDPVIYSAKHQLAELALSSGVAGEAESICLEAVRGRRRLFGTANAACCASIKLLIDIYKALNDPVEVEVWSSLLPPAELPRHESFIACDKKIRKLCSAGQQHAAVEMGIRFLRDNYEIKPFLHWNEEVWKILWAEIAENIRNGNDRGFAGWSAGMCTLHYLVMVMPVSAISEIEYLVKSGASIEAAFAMPNIGLDERGWEVCEWAARACTCLDLAALQGGDILVKRLLELGEGAQTGAANAAAKNASAFAAAGGHLRLMQDLAARGLAPGQRVRYGREDLRNALRFDRATIVEFLIEQGDNQSAGLEFDNA
jgi:hypothetical protein